MTTEHSSQRIEIVILESAPGVARRARLDHWARTAHASVPGSLDCSMANRGPWAGIDQIFESLARPLAESAPDLLHRHAYELQSAAPALHTTLPTPLQCLTDLAPEEERVRLFPRDRALRIPHGLVDLLLASGERGALPSPLVFACDGLDEAGAISWRFFAELCRRLGPVLGLRLAVGVSPGNADAVRSRLTDPARVVHPDLSIVAKRVALSSSTEPTPTLSRVVIGKTAAAGAHDAAIRANALEEKAAALGQPANEALLPFLINAWDEAGDDRRALHWRAVAFSRYTIRGLYEDAWEYGQVVVKHLDELVGQDETLRYKLLNKVFGCMATQRDPQVLRDLPAFMVAEGLDKLVDPACRAGCHYILAMLYARFLPELDPARAEMHLDLGVAELERSTAPEADRRFHIAFNRNGLALIRFRQGRTEEAVALCRAARRDLDAYLPIDRHRLHRSVLVHNIAQVYASIGDDQAAIDHLTEAIAMDPEYSEYYNERGTLHFRGGNLEAAREDYRRAIALSPPYYEVWVNLGQCLRRGRDYEGAAAAFSRALELEPAERLALIGRADCHQELGRLDLAYTDFTAVLAAAPDDWGCLANRAVALYGMGRLAESCTDLDRAVDLAPDEPELRRNRAIALTDLGQVSRARHDLQRYLELEPDTPDRPDVLARLAALSAA